MVDTTALSTVYFATGFVARRVRPVAVRAFHYGLRDGGR